MQQLDFGFGAQPALRSRLSDPTLSPAIREQWSRRFEAFFGERAFQVAFNDNASTMISCRERYGRLELNLHHMFIDADDGVLAALADFLRGRKRGAARLDQFIERNRNRIVRKRTRRGSARGRFFDLERIRDALGRAYFDGPPGVDIVWGRDSRARGQRSIRLGSYSFEDRLIRIHPALDQSFVPARVVVAVVYHELLHHALGSAEKGGRRELHSREFRDLERQYVHFESAAKWEKDNLGRLLRVRARSASTPRHL